MSVRAAAALALLLLSPFDAAAQTGDATQTGEVAETGEVAQTDDAVVPPTVELDQPVRPTGSATLLGTPTPPPGYELDPARVPAPVIERTDLDDDRVTRLEALLSAHARAAASGRVEGGILSLISGLVIVGTGITLLALDTAREPLFFILGGLSLALGIGSATTGAISLGMSSSPERRYAAFQRERARGALGARQVGRYEGALWAESETAHDQRLLGIAGAVLLASNGVIELAFTAVFARDDAFRALGYGLGGVYVALGVLELVLAFGESDAERRFREYEDGGPTLAVRPWASPTGAGVSASGTF